MPSTKNSGMPHSAVMARSRVLLLVPGGPSRMMSRPAATAASSSVELPLAADQVRGDPVVGGRQAEGLGHRIVLPASTVNSRPVT